MKREALDKYIKERHTQEECAGFIGGYESAEEKIIELFEKLTVRNCFKSDRDYNIAKQTLLEMTGIDYEEEIN